MAELTDRYWSKVKKRGPQDCWEWSAGRFRLNGYGAFYQAPRNQAAHRLSFEDANGPIPEGLFVDHMCWNQLCVNPAHLRLASQSENQQNREGAPRNSSTGVRGVSWHKKTKKYRAQVRMKGRAIHLGYYHSIKDAEREVVAFRRKNMPYSMADQEVERKP